MGRMENFTKRLQDVNRDYSGLDLSYCLVEHRMKPQDDGVVRGLLKYVGDELKQLSRPLSGHPDVLVSPYIIDSGIEWLNVATAKLQEARGVLKQYLHNKQDYEDVIGLVGPCRERFERVKGRMTTDDSDRAALFLQTADFDVKQELDDYTEIVEQILERVDGLDRLLSKYEVQEGQKPTELGV